MAGDVFNIRSLSVPCLALVLIVFADGTAAMAEMQIANISVGFEGKYKTGTWTPVRITVRGAPTVADSSLTLTADDDEGVPCQFANDHAEVSRRANGDERFFESYVCFGRRPARLKIELTIGDQVIRETWQPESDDVVSSTQQWVLVFGADPLGDSRQRTFRSAARLLDRPAGQEVRVLHLTDPTNLPESWFGYDAFDMVVVFHSDLAVWKSVQNEQWASLDQWTKLGGQILMCAGKHATQVLATDSPVSRFLPGSFSDQLVVADTSKLEAFAVATDRLDVLLQKPEWSNTWNTPTGQGGIPMALLGDVDGEVLAAEEFGGESIPLAIRGVHGLGHTFFVAFDLDLSPLRQWSGYNKLLIKLLRLTIDQQSGETIEMTSGRVAHLGFNDISGQLRTALEQFSGVRLVPFALIGIFATAYVLLIGPLEYFGLRRLNEKMHWTWLTFPLTALAVCGSAMWMTNRWKGVEPKANQVELIDWDASKGILRGQNWTHFFSPRPVTFDCRLHHGDVIKKLAGDIDSVIVWDGLPGKSFGGMDASSGLQPQIAPYTIRLGNSADTSLDVDASRDKGTNQVAVADGASRITKVEGVSLPIASSRAFRGEWWHTKAPQVASELRAQADTYVLGEIQNPFDADLRDAALLYDRWYYKLGRIPAKSTVTIDESNVASSLKSELIGRIVFDDGHMIAPWQQTNTDIPRIMQMIMFQKAAGGRSYTGLVHRHDGKLDFTRQLGAGRAVLVGRLRGCVTQLNADEFTGEQTQHWTYCRLLLPVIPFQSSMAPSKTVSTIERSP